MSDEYLHEAQRLIAEGRVPSDSIMAYALVSIASNLREINETLQRKGVWGIWDNAESNAVDSPDMEHSMDSYREPNENAATSVTASSHPQLKETTKTEESVSREDSTAGSGGQHLHACGDPDCIVPHPAPHKRRPR